ncbi:hypothetical protein CASFOL_008931 [Castilleja foliolosa]|uniref:Uncharacterized protein n=1 Tax=Castilleja foliolosa TaxID=1961234 RepID=A0ABD3E0E3_9LAMI
MKDEREEKVNSVSLINLVWVASLVDSGSDGHYRHNAERLLAVFEKRLKETAMALPLMCCGADVIHIDSNNVDEIGFWEVNNEKIAVMARTSRVALRFSIRNLLNLFLQNEHCSLSFG